MYILGHAKGGGNLERLERRDGHEEETCLIWPRNNTKPI